MESYTVLNAEKSASALIARRATAKGQAQHSRPTDYPVLFVPEVEMRSAEGDYVAIEAALKPHQLKTVRDLAAASGISTDRWWCHTTARVVAKDLAVANVLDELLHDGRTHRQAINHIASRFDLDAESLRRRLRSRRRRSSPE
jgi:hypothetical protein